VFTHRLRPCSVADADAAAARFGLQLAEMHPSIPSSEPPRQSPSHLLQGAQWRPKWVLSDSSLDVVEC